MKMKLFYYLNGALVVFTIAAFAIISEPRGSHKVDPQTEKEVLLVLDKYMSTFNARDSKAHYATYHFPHYRFASGRMTTLDSAPIDSGKFLHTLIEAGWDHTVWEHRTIVQASRDKVHVDTQFTRYRKDGSKINTYESLYVLTYENGRWGVKMRSSFAE